MENKFAAIPLRVPVTENMDAAYKLVKKVTNKIKGNIGYIYSMYALSFYSNIFLPRIIPR